jgi:hypothetical protein
VLSLSFSSLSSGAERRRAGKCSGIVGDRSRVKDDGPSPFFEDLWANFVHSLPQPPCRPNGDEERDDEDGV